MENLYLKDSPLNSVSKIMQKFILNEAYVVNFALYPMPNFADAFIREKFDQLIKELEMIPKYGIGPEGTNLWIREFSDVIIIYHLLDSQIPQIWMSSRFRYRCINYLFIIFDIYRMKVIH